MPAEGQHVEGTIVHNGMRSINGKSAAAIVAKLEDGSEYEALIWMTQAAMNMARGQLRRCGFDPDTQDIEELATNATLLEGNRVPLLFEVYKGKLQARIDLSGPPAKGEMARLTQALRDAKSQEPGPVSVDEAPPLTDSDVPF